MTARMTGLGRSRTAMARDRTRQAILETALRLFTERGYIGVRVEDIAREAGISRATFYKHFAEREQILSDLFGRLLAGEDAEPELPRGGVEARVAALLDATAERMVEDDLLARFVYSLPIRHDAVLPGGSAVPPVFARVREVLEEGAAAGEVRDDVEIERALEVLGRAFEASMRDWAEGRVDDPRTRLAELLDIVFGGIEPRRARRRR